MIRVKLCGMTSLENIQACVRAGAHCLGFVVEYPQEVPWNLAAGCARELVERVPPFVSTCMVAGGAPARVVALAKEVRPDIVQLHYRETLEETAQTAQELRALGIRTLKALRTGPEGELLFHIPDPGEAVRALEGTGICGILVDASTPDRPGGSGHPADRDIYRQIRMHTSLPVILAGGLRPDNLAAAIPRDLPPFAVDVLTGVEDSPGVKDPRKAAALCRAVAGI